MNILFLPLNIASMQPITAKALNTNIGVEAKCIVDQNIHLKSFNDTVITIRRASKKHFFRSIFDALTYFFKIKKWIKWADVLHYVYTPGDKFNRDLIYAQKLGKKIFVEFVGSDIRIPEVLFEINPYYKHAFLDEAYEYHHVEAYNKDKKLQKIFARYGAIPLLNPEMQLYLDRALFPSFHLVFPRININDFIPLYPSKSKKIPIIVHSPSALIAKGSNIILPLIEKLKLKYEFEFIIINNKPRTEALEILKKADIFIDQIILGSYGMASIEAMAFGKPTLCYIMPKVYENGLDEDCPIVNANPDTLEEKLVDLILNPELRYEIGLKSRAFVEKVHSDKKISSQLLQIYQS